MRLKQQEQLILIDVREESEYCSTAGYIPGARLYPWNSGQFQKKYRELPKSKNILLICRSGNRSGRAAAFLKEKGYSKVYNILGGMKNWPGKRANCENNN